MFTASQLLDKINNHISEIQFTRTPKGLYEPIEYILSLGGKRIRPVLMLMGYNLYREDVASIYDPATAIEVYHNHTLLHDDLMDRSDVRRGKPTVHKVWNDNTAVLSGDAMLILAFRYMTGCPQEHLKEVMDLFSLTTLEICEGQQLDMEFESRCDVTEDEYIEMIRLKCCLLLVLKSVQFWQERLLKIQRIFIILGCISELRSNCRMICWMYTVIRKCSGRR